MPRWTWRLGWVALLLVGAPALVLAQPATPLGPQEVQTSFPNSITFTLQRPSVELREAAVVYRVRRRACTPTEGRGYVTALGVGEELRWRWDLRQAGGLPPGTVVSYHWELTDGVGHTTATEEESFTWEDRRYTWREVRQDQIRLRWHQGDQAFARTLLSAATEALQRLARETATDLEDEVTIYVYGTTQELHEALVFPQEWTGGMAFPPYSTIALGAPPERTRWARSALAHELAHLVVHQAAFNCYSPPPSWLDEGLATWADGTEHRDYRDALDAARGRGDLFSVRGLSDGFPTRREDALLAYAQSLSFVEYLLEAHGGERMRSLLEGFRLGSNDDAALLSVYGFDQEGLDGRWRRWLGLPTPEAVSAPAALLPPQEPVEEASPPAQEAPLAPPEPQGTPLSETPRLRFLECAPSGGQASGVGQSAPFSVAGPLPLAVAGGILFWKRRQR